MGLRQRLRREKKRKAKLTGVEKDMELAGEDGKIIAIASACLILHREFDLGLKRIVRILEQCSEHCNRMDSDGIQYMLQVYSERITFELLDVNIPKKKTTVMEMMALNQRDRMYVTYLAHFCVTLTEFNYSSNNKKTGRMDRFLRCSRDTWMLMHCGKTAREYQQELLDEIGLRV